MKIQPLNLFTFGLATLFAGSTWARETGAAANDLPLLQPQVKTVAAFKNGLAFVLKTGDTPLKNGWARMGPLPPATLGSLWIGSQSGPVTDVIASREKVAEDADPASLEEMLAANVGHEVLLTYALSGTSKTAEGKLLPMGAERKSEATARPPYSPYYRPELSENLVVAPNLVLLRSTNLGPARVLALPKTAIQSLEILDGANLKTRRESEQELTKIHVGGNPSRAEITVAALEKGLVWSPGYRLNLIGDTQAEIELNAVFADDAEDLDHAEVSLVVGYPNFVFSDVTTPLSLRQSVAEFVRLLAAGGNNQAGRNINGLANVMTQAARYEPAGGMLNEYATGQPLPGEQDEDLYFYHKQDVTLKKGDRESFSVFKATVPCEPLYQWEMPDNMNVDDRGYQMGRQNQQENPVWHVLRLENKSGQPWTTAPALVMNHDLPIAQDTLSYTPAGGRNYLKLTAATDVRGEQSQTESARKPVRLEDRNYDEVTVAGKLKLTNFKTQDIKLIVRKTVIGEVLESPDGKVTKLARNLTAVNPNSEMEWEFSLPAGKDRELTYQYKVLIGR